MTRVIWDNIGEKGYETGIDQVVLYVPGKIGVAWNGVTSVQETPRGGEATSYYFDGEKYLNLVSRTEFSGTINAYFSPDEFDACDGTNELQTGFSMTEQRRVPFGLCYRTKKGNDSEGMDFGYKLHLVMNAKASPSSSEYSTLGDSVTPTQLSWGISTTPIRLPDGRSGSHFVIDSTEVNPGVMDNLEGILYGTGNTNPRMPTYDEILNIFIAKQVLIITDNGDGTFTAQGPDTVVWISTKPDEYTISWPSVIQIGDTEEYTISSM